MAKKYIRFGQETHAINQKFITRNYSKGRSGKKIKRIVLHTVGAQSDPQGIYNHFNRARESGSSAHYYVHKDGSIWQYVKDDDMAWHAGTRDAGHPNNNLESIGIEFWDGGKWSGSAGKKRTDELYHNGAWLLAYLCEKHGVKCELLPRDKKWSNGITKHNDYANKACPGDLDRPRLSSKARDFMRREEEDGQEPETPPTEPPSECSNCEVYRNQIAALKKEIKELKEQVSTARGSRGLLGDQITELNSVINHLEAVIEEKDGLLEQESNRTRKWKAKYESLLKEVESPEPSEGSKLQDAIRKFFEALFGKPE